MTCFDYQGENIYYVETGNEKAEKTVMFLHGNTSSSKFFELLLPLYQEEFRIILIDFLGYGNSSKLVEFPLNLWQEEADQVIDLLAYLNYSQVALVGTSGGAWVALKAALLRPDLITYVVADSFDGRTLHEGFIEEMTEERKRAAKDSQASQFYQWCLGEDWQQIVQMDTAALVRFVAADLPLFQLPLATLKVPLLLLGSHEDQMLRKDLLAEYQAIVKNVRDGRIHLFETGGHPTIATNAEAAAKQIKKFLLI